MEDLSALFAAALSEKPELADKTLSVAHFKPQIKLPPELENAKGKALARPTPPKTILQLNSMPFAIDVNQYKNPHSSDNPTGDYKAAYRLSLLADPIPQLSAYYSDSLYSTKKLWRNIVNSATSLAPYTQYVVGDARDTFNNSKMSGMGGIPEDWYPVSTKPSNWYDMVQKERNMTEIEIRAAGDTGGQSFITLDNQNDLLSWKLNMGSEIDLHTETTIKVIRLKVLRVDFVRPWFDFEVFRLQNWSIGGLDNGYYSNGQLTENDGIFPLVTIGMLIGTRVSIEGSFSEKDLEIINNSQKNGDALSLGPFMINTGEQSVEVQFAANTVLESNIQQVIGYLSNLIPLSPAV